MSRIRRWRIWRWWRIAAGLTGPGVSEHRLRRRVAGRTVLVTGASEGIGAATAVRLAQAGATVLLVARTAQRLDAVRDQIAAAGGTAYAYPADLSRPEQAEALGEELIRSHRRVDVVVHCAGRSIRRPVLETADRFHDLRRTIDLNFLGPVQLLLVLLPAMCSAGGGHVVNVSTAGVGVPAQNWSSYLASKTAFDVWLRSAAPELRRNRVQFSTIYCGLVRTRMSAPTPHYRRMPAMSPQEAAGMVCRAVALRRRTQRVWWARGAEVFATAFAGTYERMLSLQPRIAPMLDAARALNRIGLLRPGRAVRLASGWWRYGSSLAAAAASGPRSGIAIVDEAGAVRRRDLAAAAGTLAAGASRLGIGPGDRVAVSCGPHRGFVVTTVALGLLGADAVLLAPDLPAGRRAEILARERVGVFIHDGADAGATELPCVEWTELTGAASESVAPEVAGRAATRTHRGRRRGQLVVLTSGTTGTPRSVRRRVTVRSLLGPVTTHLRLIPLRPGAPIVVAAPPHHGYGLTYLSAGLTLGFPVVLAAGQGPERLLALAAEHRAQALIALPVQLSRICDLPGPAPDLPHLRAVVTGSAPLSPGLCERLLERFGDRVFNLYGTTETGWAAIAGPEDLKALPGTVGRAPYGVGLRVVDDQDRPLPPGYLGQVQVRGWEPGGGWSATGDVGRLDRVGRLLLEGRVDDMIVSGGENVYPGPVARVLSNHPDVVDVVVRPVPDAEFGQRLGAWVQVRPGAFLTEQELRAWSAERLTRAERPRDIVLVDEPAAPANQGLGTVP